jgi:2-hydroxychromene-2-carboxylate isomerase
MARIEVVFDYSSPYAYFGSLLVEKVAQQHGLDIEWTPIVLGGIFQARNHTAPIMGDDLKGPYLLEDLRNLSEVYGIPYQPRTEFIVKSILPLRATLAVPRGPERGKAVHALFHGAWAENLDMSDPANVKRLLDAAGFDGGKLVDATKDQAIKDELKANTDHALKRGVFGTPTFILENGKKFWGHDRLDVVEHYLKAA